MDIDELKTIESAEGVEFALKPDGKIIIKGTDTAIDRALERIAAHRDEVAAVLRENRPADEPAVERVIAANVPPLAVQREMYIKFFMAHGEYWHPSTEQLDLMFSVLEEGDEVLPDFAHSFSVRRRNGSIVQVDRKGRVTPVSPYSPAVRPI
jgi:hypothetical protein